MCYVVAPSRSKIRSKMYLHLICINFVQLCRFVAYFLTTRSNSWAVFALRSSRRSKKKLFYESTTWKQYVPVNRRFADIIMGHVRDGDISMLSMTFLQLVSGLNTLGLVWVNDYHLMPLPALIRNHPTCSSSNAIARWIPLSEIFRCISVRESLLNGILGFQTATFARHFRPLAASLLMKPYPREDMIQKTITASRTTLRTGKLEMEREW